MFGFCSNFTSFSKASENKLTMFFSEEVRQKLASTSGEISDGGSKGIPRWANP